MAHVFFVGVAGASVQSQGQKNLHEDKRSTLCGPNLGKRCLARSTMATVPLYTPRAIEPRRASPHFTQPCCLSIPFFLFPPTSYIA